MKDPGAVPRVRIAVLAGSDPCRALRRWKALSGRKAVACPPRFPVPEIVQAVGMLPVFARSDVELRAMSPLIDERAFLPEPFPPRLEGALDWVESFAEWAEKASGEPCREGALERSMRARLERDSLAERLAERCAASRPPLEPAEFRAVIDSGRFLPVETHAFLLSGILGEDIAVGSPGKADGGDPFLRLALRVRAEMDGERASGAGERRIDP